MCGGCLSVCRCLLWCDKEHLWAGRSIIDYCYYYYDYYSRRDLCSTTRQGCFTSLYTFRIHTTPQLPHVSSFRSPQRRRRIRTQIASRRISIGTVPYYRASKATESRSSSSSSQGIGICCVSMLRAICRSVCASTFLILKVHLPDHSLLSSSRPINSLFRTSSGGITNYFSSSVRAKKIRSLLSSPSL